MGDRGVVRIVDTGVVLYTHWGATRLPHVLATALGREARWSDPPYLARIIVSELLRGSLDATTGYGIGTAVPADAWRVIDVDCATKTVRFVDGHGFHPDPEAGETYRFPAFVTAFAPEPATAGEAGGAE